MNWKLFLQGYLSGSDIKRSLEAYFNVIHLCKIYDQTLEALCDPSVYLDLDLLKEAKFI